MLLNCYKIKHSKMENVFLYKLKLILEYNRHEAKNTNS